MAERYHSFALRFCLFLFYARAGDMAKRAMTPENIDDRAEDSAAALQVVDAM